MLVDSGKGDRMRAAFIRGRVVRLGVVATLIVGGSGIVLVNRAAGGAPPRAAPTRDTACSKMRLYAEQLPNGQGGATRLGYGLSPGKASIPGPLITMYEGDCLKITLTNDIPTKVLKAERKKYGYLDLPLGASIHPHGVKYDQASDGTDMTDSITKPGKSRTYTWRAAPGTAGYWWYHDHAVGTDHGSGGQADGLFGGLIVRKAGDPLPDVPTFVAAFGDDSTIDLQRYPDTPTFTATQGQRVEFLVFAWGNDLHSFHLHAHSWADDRTGIPDPNDPSTPTIDTKILAPGDSFGFQVTAGDVSGPGDWMYHCHIQSHSDAGMWGIFEVLPAEA